MKMVMKFLDNRMEEVIVTVSLAIMFILVSVQIFMRYVMQNSLSWSEELARYLFILFVNVGISFGVKTKTHIRVEVFSASVGQKAKVVIQVLSDIIFLAFAVVVVYYGSITAMKIFTLNQESPALGLPMGLIYATLPVSYIAVGVRLIQNIVEPFRTLKHGGSV